MAVYYTIRLFDYYPFFRLRHMIGLILGIADQKFIYGRNIFDNIEQIVDDIFNTYIRRIGYVEPLAAKFCNGTTTTCDGLSQWGSQYLAQDGYDSMQILRTYYGDGIELVPDAPVQGVRASYPGSPL